MPTQPLYTFDRDLAERELRHLDEHGTLPEGPPSYLDGAGDGGALTEWDPVYGDDDESLIVGLLMDAATRGWVYPEGHARDDRWAILYVTDGEWFTFQVPTHVSDNPVVEPVYVLTGWTSPDMLARASGSADEPVTGIAAALHLLSLATDEANAVLTRLNSPAPEPSPLSTADLAPPTDTEVLDLIAVALGDSQDWGADMLDRIANLVALARPHPGDSQPGEYRRLLEEATGRTAASDDGKRRVYLAVKDFDGGTSEDVRGVFATEEEALEYIDGADDYDVQTWTLGEGV